MHNGKICVALVGIGWAGVMHAKAYNHLYNMDVDLKTVCALEPTVSEFAERYNFRSYTNDFNAVLNDEEIDVVDIVTPPNLHKSMAISAMCSGKHVICEKPLTGYFGVEGDPQAVGTVSKKKMLFDVRSAIDEMETAIAQTGKKFCYAANWIYSPAFLRACELVKAKGTTVLQIQGLVGHKGSSADYVRHWARSGGGTLARNIVHPLSAAVYLKRMEMESKGLSYGVKSVMCDCSQITAGVDNRYIEADPIDTEDWAHAIFTFADGTKAILTAADTFVGECSNKFEIYGNDAVLKCNFSPNNLLDIYFSDEKDIKDEHISEKSDHNIGHKQAAVCEEVVRGYYSEIQDFMECIKYDREPLAGFKLAREVTDLVQLAYCAAEQGMCVELADYMK